jgi:hypothetical protein
MGLLDRFKELDTPVQLLLVVGVVIGGFVALVVLIALLVVLASVVGAFTLGLGEDVQTAPTATFEIDGTPDGAQITHSGGDAIEADNLYVAVDDNRRPWRDYGSTGTVGTGDSIVVPAEPGQTVRVIYDDGETSAVLEQTTIE